MNIFEIQAHLRALGGSRADLVVDGKMGPKTEAAVRYLTGAYGLPADMPLDRALVAVEQIVMKVIGGLAVGPIDGIVGSATEKARKHWMRGPWRSELLQKLPGDERMPEKLKRWPTAAELESFFGAPGANQTTLHMPFPITLAWDTSRRVQTIKCHEAVAEPLRQIWTNTLAHYGLVRIQKLRLNIFGGCFNVRPMRGSTRLSTHAWGIAWDVDPINNMLRADHKKALLARPEYDAFWQIVTEQGALSLGKARDFDWMHFQFCNL